MTKLHQLFQEQGQSPWLDNLTRGHLLRGELERLVAAGIRGVTSNPTIFAKAISSSDDYDEQFRILMKAGMNVTDAYWTMVIDDIRGALAVLRPIYDDSRGATASFPLSFLLNWLTKRPLRSRRHADCTSASLLPTCS